MAEWFREYNASHANATNRLLHCIFIPPLVLAVMGLLCRFALIGPLWLVSVYYRRLGFS